MRISGVVGCRRNREMLPAQKITRFRFRLSGVNEITNNRLQQQTLIIVEHKTACLSLSPLFQAAALLTSLSTWCSHKTLPVQKPWVSSPVACGHPTPGRFHCLHRLAHGSVGRFSEHHQRDSQINP